MMRMVAGLESITAGEISIDGKVVNKLEPAERDIAMVFQNYALYPHMTVFENMAYGLKIRKFDKKEIRKRVDSAAQILELSHLLDRRPRQLSGGQRQRVAMGRAIVRDPKVFLFDEPLSNLDAKLRVQMRLEIQKLHRRLRTTSLYVTHDQVEAMTLAQRMVVMNKGIVEQIGTPVEVFERPASIFVASFIGSPPMNLLPVQIDAQRRVVHQEGHAVGRELHVALDHAVAVLRAEAERRQRVLRRQLAGAAVRDPARIGPGVHAAILLPLPASNRCSRSSRGLTRITWSARGAGWPSSMRTMSCSPFSRP
jgi:ABC-type sugar transport system ATPase subunit